MQIGPRLELQLIKVQEGLAEGRVLYHRFEQRSAEAAAAQEAATSGAAQLRAERRRQQEENIKRKAQEAAREKAARQVRLVYTCKAGRSVTFRIISASWALGRWIDGRTLVRWCALTVLSLRLSTDDINVTRLRFCLSLCGCLLACCHSGLGGADGAGQEGCKAEAATGR